MLLLAKIFSMSLISTRPEDGLEEVPAKIFSISLIIFRPKDGLVEVFAKTSIFFGFHFND